MSSTNFKKSPDKNLSVILVSYNVKNKITKCLRNLEQKFKEWEVVVIDNNSKDGSFEAIKKQFMKKIVLRRNFKNVGFSRAVNQGIKLSSKKYVLFLNPDTLPSVKTIEKLINFAKKDDSVGIVGGEMLKVGGIERHGTYVSKPTFLIALFDFTNLRKIFPNNVFHRKFYYKEKKVYKAKNVWGVSGGFMLIKKNVIQRIGGLDEKFFMYLEDIDFCLRARKAGFKVVYYPKASIIHDSGSSSPNKYHIDVKAWRNSRRYFFKKHLGLIQGTILSFLFLMDELFVNLKHKIYG